MDNLDLPKSKFQIPVHSEVSKTVDKSRQKMDVSLQEYGYTRGDRPNI